jgi:microcystin-dependent protein
MRKAISTLKIGTLSVTLTLLTCFAGSTLVADEAKAQYFTSEIKAFALNFCPLGWSAADGSTLEIGKNESMYALLGTTYGGDGRSTFGLPDLSGRVPMGAGTGTGLSPNALGESSGEAVVELRAEQLPAHDHALANHVHDMPVHDHTATLHASLLSATEPDPEGNSLGTWTAGSVYAAGDAHGETFSPSSFTVSENSDSVVEAAGAGDTGAAGKTKGVLEVRAPTLALTICICTESGGECTYPARS